MKPSRNDIPQVAAGVRNVEALQLADAIRLYSSELEKAIANSDKDKMISAGNVLVALLGRNNKVLREVLGNEPARI